MHLECGMQGIGGNIQCAAQIATRNHMIVAGPGEGTGAIDDDGEQRLTASYIERHTFVSGMQAARGAGGSRRSGSPARGG